MAENLDAARVRYHINYNYVDCPLSFGDVLLFQIGRRYCGPAEVIREHAHLNWYELTVVTGGEGTVTTDGNPFHVAKGDIYLSFPTDFHQIESSADHPLKYDFYSFNSTDEEIRTALAQITADRMFYFKRVVRSEKIGALVSSAIGEFCGKKDYRDEILALTLKQIALYLIRCFRDRAASCEKINVDSADEICFQIMHYIDTNIYSLQSLGELSGALGYNYSYLSDIFRKTTGNTVQNYYRDSRLETARLLLLEGKFKCNRIAEVLNYASPFSFSKAFKAKYGAPPKRYAQEWGVKDQQP